MLAEILAIIIETLILGLTVHSVLKPKFCRKTDTGLFFAFVILFSTIVFLVNQAFPFETYISVVYLLAMAAYAMFCFQDNWYRKLTLSVLPFVVLILSSVLTGTLIPLLYDADVLATFEGGTYLRVISLLAAKGIQGILSCVLVLMMKAKRIHLDKREWLGFLIIFTAVCFCGVFAFQIRITEDVLVESEMFLCTVLCLVLMIVFTFVFYVRFGVYSKNVMELRLREERMLAQTRSAEELETMYEQLRSLRHDIKHQFGAVHELLARGESEEAKQYLDKMLCEAEHGLEDTYYIMTMNKPVDAVLNSFYRKCIENSIQTEFEVRETELKQIDVYDLCLVISNLCENAYEACERCGRKQIRLELCNKRSYIWFRIGNAIEHSVLRDNQELATTKENKSEHGFGMKTVRRLVEKYEGAMEVYEADAMFWVEVILKTSKVI